MTTLAEYNQSRAVERIILNKPEIDKLAQRIVDLHKSIETIAPAFEVTELVDLGGRLCTLILQGKVRSLFDIATGESPELLPFELFVEDPAITGWPWEYVYDSINKKFLSQEFHPISRGIFTVFPARPLRPIKDRVRILLVLGVLPGDKSTPENEVQWIKEVFDTQLATDSVELVVKHSLKPEDLDREIQRNRYDVIHYFGHAKFDGKRDEGFLSLEQPGAAPFPLYANEFARMLTKKNIRLVFLNGCETARSSKTEDPARSSIAAALLAHGIPAIIATQFSIPDVTAHYLSSMTYNSLVTSKPLVEAMSHGRRAMSYSKMSQITDWGIPVLYTTNPELVIFPKPKGKRSRKWAGNYHEALKSKDVLKALAQGATPQSPAMTVERTAITTNKKIARMRVALVDFDARAGFLPELAKHANEIQHFYNFEVNYFPLPSGAIRTDLVDKRGKAIEPQLYLPYVEDYLFHTPKNLKVHKVCCLTRSWIAGVNDDDGGKPFETYRYSALNTNENVLAVSVAKLVDYAKQASTSYAKAILYVCLSGIVASDERLPELIHDETVGCLFDNCPNEGDLVVGLKNMKFEHASCRRQIKNKQQLGAIDALLALDINANA
ncbi:MAG: CHAT domain-containing protein [Pyrinomonadaceae bacterium]